MVMPKLKAPPSFARRVRWTLIGTLLILLPPVGTFMLSRMRTLVSDTVMRQMESQARLLAAAWDRGSRGFPLRPDIQMRVTVVGKDGRVLLDTWRDARTMENHMTRPEIRDALAGGIGSKIEYSPTTQQPMQYVAVPIKDGALRVAVPMSALDAQQDTLRSLFLWGFLVIVAIGLLVAEGAARYVTAPLRRLLSSIRCAGVTDRVPEEGPSEVTAVVDALNEARERVRQQYRALQTEHDRLEAILVGIEEGVVLSEADGRVLYVNPSAARLLDVEAAALMGRRFAERYDGFAPSRVLEGLASEADVQEELRLPEHDRSLTLHTLSMKDHAGRCVGRMALLRDISEYVRTERLRREFVANASHELRTPVAAAAVALEAVELAGDDARTRNDFLSRAQAEVEGLRQLIESLLDLSLAEELGTDVDAPSIDAVQIAREVVEGLQPLAARRSQQLRLTDNEVAFTPMRSMELARVLRNLVDNAIKYTPEGGTINVTVAREAETVCVHVVDSGPGIPTAQLQRVFERFFRVDRSRVGTRGGTGLGLAIARHLVERAGGRMEAANDADGGAHFRVVLPRA